MIDYYANQIFSALAIAAIVVLLFFSRKIRREFREMLQAYLGGIALITVLGILVFAFFIMID